jgi:hypothetical protein
MKANGEKQYYYTRERINAFASLIVALVIIALLIVPIYLLYSLVKNNGDADGVLNDRATATCIGILLTFTLLFSAVISLFTRAKRHEVLGAAAGYVWIYLQEMFKAYHTTDTAPCSLSSWAMCRLDVILMDGDYLLLRPGFAIGFLVLQPQGKDIYYCIHNGVS